MGIDCLNETATAAKPNPVRKTYKCNVDECGKSFQRRQHLRKHIETHSKDMVQKSREELAIGTMDKGDEIEGSESFTRKSVGIKHNKNIHTDDNISQVNRDQKQYKCEEPDCNAVFRHSNRLQRHKLVYHCPERPFKCDFQGCDKGYINDAHLKRHKIASHSTRKVASEQVFCKVIGCGNVYCNKYVLKQHMATAHMDSEDIVKANNSKKKCDIEKRHRCDEPGCEATFGRPYRLKNHKLTVHGGERPFQCDYEGCDKSYTNESHLARHKKISHCLEQIDTTKEVLCEEDDCGRIFSNKYNLKRHLAVCHTDLPFACRECDEKFKRKSQLHAHMVEVHEKEAPYKCSMCPKMFIHWHLYQKHLKNHKTYECDCKETFDKWSKLLKHRKTECTVKIAAPKCIICEKTFASKRVLREHSLLVHIPDSQIDLLQCPYLNCNRSYKYKNGLRYHIRTCHEKLFKTIRCPEKNCETVLKSNRYLKQHLRIVHHGLPAKIRKPRKPRKDKGIPKTSMASVISGFEVSAEENVKNIAEKMDENLKEEASVKVECCENDNEVVSNNRLKINHKSRKDIRSCKRKSNAENKQVEWSTKNKSLIGGEETMLDVVKSIPLPNDVERTDGIFKNCHDTTSLSVISMDLIDECAENPIQNNSKNTTSLSVISMDLVDDCSGNPIQNNSGTKSTKRIKDFTNNSEEINSQNGTSDYTVYPSNFVEIIMGTSEPLKNPGILEMSSVQLGERQNGELNNVEKVLQSKSKSVESIQSIIGGSCVVSENTVNTAEMQQDLLHLDTDMVSLNSGQNSCNSEVVIFDFPEFENIDHSKNMQTLTGLSKERDVDRNIAINSEGSSDANYISDEEKLKKRLGVMLNDISSVLKHL